MLTIVLLLFLAFLVLGVPIAFSMGGSATLAIIIGSNIPWGVVVQRMYEGLNSFSLLAIPLFMLAGQLMESGGISRRLVDFAYSFLGFIKGGLGISSIATSTIFAGISGSAAADTAAVGSIMIPAMKSKRYPPGLAATIQACGGSLGTIIPPSMVMIIYGSLTGISIGSLFLAGIIPGILMSLGLALVTYFYGRKYNLIEAGSIQIKEVIRTFTRAIWALLLPIIIIGGILTGFFTATEAGVVAVLYSLIVGLVFYKEYHIRELPRIIKAAASNTSMAVLIIAGASILGWLIAIEQLPGKIIASLTTFSTSPLLIMLLIVVFIIFLGMFIETIAATIIVAPILVPIINQFGYDPIHFGFVMVACFVFAGITPPVGGILYITAGIANTKLKNLLQYLIPYAGVMFLVVLLVIFFPELATYLPEQFLK